MDIASLRAELKAWERDFRSQHARNPTVQEIKDQPDIAAKYRLYRSLSKSSSSSSILQVSAACPHTSPRSQSRQRNQTTDTATTSLVPKGRAVRIDPPIQTTNPFSPAKNKHRPLCPKSPIASQSIKLPERVPDVNPFTTPTKPKPRLPAKSKPSTQPRSPSPDPFPLIQALQGSQPLTVVAQTPSSQSAMTRARKRLRGEPVSPSPVKDKRARVGSQRSLDFPRTLLDSDDEDVHMPHRHTGAANETFIEATPMKPPLGGKPFRVLFEDVLPISQEASRLHSNRTLSRAVSAAPKPNALNHGRSQSRAMSPASSEDEGDGWENGAKLKGLITSTNGPRALKAPALQQRRRMMNGSGKNVPSAVLPTKDDLMSENGPSKVPAPNNRLAPGSIDINRESRTGSKRPRHDDHEEMLVARADIPRGLAETRSISHLPYLPPSPTRSRDSHSTAGIAGDRGKGKAAAAFNRKKARLLEQLTDNDDNTEDVDSDEGHVKLREHSWNSRKAQTAHSLDELDDPEFQWPAHPIHSPDSPALTATIAPSTVEVQLPEDMKRILALDSRQSTELEERRLVDGLLYGRRETHCDAMGREIWDAGEFSEGGEATGQEDEWEGEPVPWEVGEL